MMSKCYRCGTTENLTDYEYWGRVEWYCENCFDEMNRGENAKMSESKTHLIADESLGGVLREFVEVEREAKDGDFAVFKTEYKGITPGKPYEINVTKPHGGMIEFYDDNGDEHWWDIPSEEFTIVESTDIVQIDGVRYRMVDRKAKVGEKVIVVVANDTLVYRNVGEIVEIIETDGSSFGGMIRPHDFGKKGAIYHFQYLVLEPLHTCDKCGKPLGETACSNQKGGSYCSVDCAKADDETEASKSIIDLLASLAQKIVELERKIDRLEERTESNASDIETWSQEVTRLTDNQSVTLTFDSATIAKIMAKVVAEWR